MKKTLFLVLLLLMAMPMSSNVRNLTCDVNGNGFVDISDITALIDYLLTRNDEAIVMDNADINYNGFIDIADVTDLIDMILQRPANHQVVTDGITYNQVNGIGIKNIWIKDRVHDPEDWTSQPYCSKDAQTAVMDNGYIYIARSNARTVSQGDQTIEQCVIYQIDATNGQLVNELPLKLNGVPYGQPLGVASIGKDNFHHIWVAPHTSILQQYIPVYMVNTETGELTLIVEIDKGEDPHITDYLDVIGDLMREEAECNIMAVSGSTTVPGFPTLYRVHADQYGDWEGGFDGDSYMDVINFYPDTKIGFGMTPVIKMIETYDDDNIRYSGELFYIDCYDTAPVVYYYDGEVFDSFEEVHPLLWPQFRANGCTEFLLGDRVFLVYAFADMIGSGDNCTANICEMDKTMLLALMTKYWKIPADGLGTAYDDGLGVHCFSVDYGIDDEGNEEVTLFYFKTYNGMAVYKIGPNVQ